MIVLLLIEKGKTCTTMYLSQVTLLSYPIIIYTYQDFFGYDGEIFMYSRFWLEGNLSGGKFVSWTNYFRH